MSLTNLAAMAVDEWRRRTTPLVMLPTGLKCNKQFWLAGPPWHWLRQRRNAVGVASPVQNRQCDGISRRKSWSTFSVTIRRHEFITALGGRRLKKLPQCRGACEEKRTSYHAKALHQQRWPWMKGVMAGAFRFCCYSAAILAAEVGVVVTNHNHRLRSTTIGSTFG